MVECADGVKTASCFFNIHHEYKGCKDTLGREWLFDAR